MSRKFNHAILRIKNANGKFEPLSALRGQNSYELAVKAGFTGSEEEWMEYIIGDGWIGAYQDLEARVITIETSRIVRTNVIVDVDAFENTGEYNEYPYRAAIPIEGATINMIPDVIFGINDVGSGLFAPGAATYDGGVYIYAASIPADIVTIPTIVLEG